MLKSFKVFTGKTVCSKKLQIKHPWIYELYNWDTKFELFFEANQLMKYFKVKEV